MQEEGFDFHSSGQPILDEQASQTNHSLSTSDSDRQALSDTLGLLDGQIDPSLADLPQAEIENWEGMDEFMADFIGDSNNVTNSTPGDSDNVANKATSEKSADTETRCWEHGCNGKKFSTRSNLLRHQIEKGKARPNFTCPICGAYFSRTTARNQHVDRNSCNRVRRYSNGRERPRPRVID